LPVSLVFVHAEIGEEASVLEALRNVEGFVEGFLLSGVYEVVVRIKADTLEKLREIIASRVRELDKVLSTNAFFVVE
jgi:DNA-binding Lrp family transcriptional regulator